MTKKPFRTLFRPISLNRHQQFFMEILSRHQWEAQFLWPFTDLVYLLEQEQENIDPETYVKELVVANPIILNALRTTIKQETKKQFSKNISHTYTNRIFPLATKTELRQGGRKQSVQTLIKLIHSVEKYYDEHNGQRKESRANTIKEDPKKWTWQLYQELNQALLHPSATYQKLFYQNYANLENRTSHKKNPKDFHIDHQDVIKQLEILLLPAIEKTRHSKEHVAVKRSAKVKGNLQGNFKYANQAEQVSISQIKNLLLRTSHIRKDTIDRHRILRSKLVHSRMIKTLLSNPRNKQRLQESTFNTFSKWDEVEKLIKLDMTHTLKRGQLKTLVYNEELQKTFAETKALKVTLTEFPVLENRLNAILERVVLKKTSRNQAVKQSKSFENNLTRETQLKQTVALRNHTLKRSQHQTLVYKEELQKTFGERKELKVSAAEFPVLENRLKTIRERVALQRTYVNQVFKQSKAFENNLTRETQLKQTVALRNHALKRSQHQTLVYKEELQKTFGERKQLKVETKELPVRESQLKTIRDRVVLQSTFINQVFKQSRAFENNLTRETQLKQTVALRNHTLKHSQHQTLVYKEELQKTFGERKQLKVETKELPILENKLKTIRDRVALQSTFINQVFKHSRALENDLTRETQLKQTDGLRNHALKRSQHQTLVYKAELQKTFGERKQLKVETKELPVLESQLKTIRDRVALQSTLINQVSKHSRAFENNLTRETQLKQTVALRNHTLKRSQLQTLVYKEELQKTFSEGKPSKAVVADLPVLENKLKTILSQVSVRNILIKGEEIQRRAFNRRNIINHSTMVNHSSLINQSKLLNHIKTLENRTTHNTQFQPTSLSRNNVLKRSQLKSLVYQEQVLRNFSEESNTLTQSSLVRRLSTSSTLNSLNRNITSNLKQLNRVKALEQKNIIHTEVALSDEAIEAIEALKVTLATAKEREKTEMAHEKLLVTTSRNLVVKNRQESELRHVSHKLKPEALQTERPIWQPKKLSTKSTKVKHHETPPLVQAVSKTVDKTWIREIIKETNLTERNTLADRNIIAEKTTSGERPSAVGSISASKVTTIFGSGALTGANADSGAVNGDSRINRFTDKEAAFEMDAQKIDLIADQVFKRVTDKIERERKRRGM